MSSAVRGGLLEPEGARLDSGGFTLALAKAAERLGATLILRRAMGVRVAGDRVAGVLLEDGDVTAPAVVIAMGPWSARAAGWVGESIPVRPLKGERLTLKLPGPPIPWLISTPRRGHMISRADGLLSVGSTAGRDFDQKDPYLVEDPNLVTLDVQPSDAALTELLACATEILPRSLPEATVVERLAGVRPLTPDRMAMIGPGSALGGVYFATGHGTKGVHLAAVTGKLIAEMVSCNAEKQPPGLDCVDPTRFRQTTGIESSSMQGVLDD